MSRMLAAKAALATRVDALGDESVLDLGANHKVRLEERLRCLEDGAVKRLSGSGKVKAKFEKYHGKSEVKMYPTGLDTTSASKKRKHSETGLSADTQVKEEKVKDELIDSDPVPKKKKKKKNSQSESGVEDTSVLESSVAMDTSSSEKKKKKKKKQSEDGAEEASVLESSTAMDNSSSEKKKKKKKKQSQSEDGADTSVLDSSAAADASVSEKKKKKKKNLDESAS